MREIKSGDIIMRIRASNLARTFFFQEFGTDLDAELEPIIRQRMDTAKKMLAGLSEDELKLILGCEGIQKMDTDAATKALQGSGIINNQKLTEKLCGLAMKEVKLSGMSALKLLWAMNAAQNFSEGAQTPNFDKWVSDYDDFNLNSCMADIIAEIDRGFFTS